ncbi:response regulator [bacterium]|nr:response regulator [bacterium]
MKILVVDDDLINRKFLSAMLLGFGEIDSASSGFEAVEFVKIGLAEGNAYDLIFLDIMMPDMDGIETLQKIRKIEEDNGIHIGNGSKIIMATALADKQDVFSAFSKGCEYYLIKPIQQERVFELLNEMGFSNNR